MSEKNERWGAAEMIITVVSVLASVGVGALIFYWATRTRTQQIAYTPVQYTPPLAAAPPPPNLDPVVDQIRGLIRAANAGSFGAADQALALLDSTEAQYGSALSDACDPAKLRRLIARVQAKQAA